MSNLLSHLGAMDIPYESTDPYGQLHDCFVRFQQGDAVALDDLFRFALQRLDHLATLMMRKFPSVRRWNEVDDVRQLAAIRLLGAMQRATPESLVHFLHMTARGVRWVLIDLARECHRWVRPSSLENTDVAATGTTFDFHTAEAQDTDLESLLEWSDFHEQVERLPDTLRSVFDLRWYAGLRQHQVASILGISERQVQRLWREARLWLRKRLA